MNAEAQRIAIAEACGWTRCRLAVKGSGGGFRQPTAHGFPPGKSYEVDCPDYINDLNAMHEAEKRLTAVQHAQYIQALEELCEFDICFATAAQRAEAFLRTIGRWEE
jgi:hypothetical protein